MQHNKLAGNSIGLLVVSTLICKCHQVLSLSHNAGATSNTKKRSSRSLPSMSYQFSSDPCASLISHIVRLAFTQSSFHWFNSSSELGKAKLSSLFLLSRKKPFQLELSPHSKSKPFPMMSSWCHEELVSLLVLACFVSVSSEGLIKFHLLPCENWRRVWAELQHYSGMRGSNAKRSKPNRCTLGNTPPQRAEVKAWCSEFLQLKSRIASYLTDRRWVYWSIVASVADAVLLSFLDGKWGEYDCGKWTDGAP